MNNILEIIKEEKIISIIRLSNSEEIPQAVESLQRGGIRLVEITFNTPNALKTISDLKNRFSNLHVGAGTVLDAASARSAIEAGADFLLAPTLNRETIQTGNRYNIPVIPGVYTPTEALNAYEYGAKMVKVFPARSVGISFAKDLKGPMPFIDVMAVGGINPENSGEFLNNKWDAVGIGSSLVNDDLIKESQFEVIESQARTLVNQKNK